MSPRRTHKKNLIVSYKNLADDLKELFKERYPEGYTDYLQRFDKPNGDTIFVVPLETEDAVYMIKFDVKIDTTLTDDDVEKDFFDEEVEKADEEFAPLQEAIDKEENGGSSSTTIRHGDYADETPKRRSKNHGSLGDLGKELEEAFSDDYDDDDDIDDDPDDGDRDDDDDFEPTDADLMDIDSDFYMQHAEIPPEEQARIDAQQAAAAPRKRGRPRKDAVTAPAVPAAPKKKGRPRKNPID